mmetsp:Transcript_134/g.493  ORF Transcript_134/g.493 Transcript_134/m.493 type:complete len:175 (-) Transcript_134:3-527(-)
MSPSARLVLLAAALPAALLPAEAANSTAFLAPRSSTSPPVAADLGKAGGGNGTAPPAPRGGLRRQEAVDMDVDEYELLAADGQCAGFALSRCAAWVRQRLPGNKVQDAAAEETACCTAQFAHVARDLPWWAWPLIVIGSVACALCLVCSLLKLGWELIKAILCCPWRCCSVASK